MQPGDSAGGYASRRRASGPGLGHPPAFVLAVHNLEGSLGLPLVAPSVRLHILDVDTGLPRWRWHRDVCQSVYNLDANGSPFLRPASGADASRAVAPFSTKPCASRGHRARLSWDERFLVLEGLHAGALLLVEVVDGDAEETHSAPLAWGFLLVDAALERSGFRRPVRLQMHRCLGAGPVRLLRNWILGPATDQSEDLEKAGREQRTAPRIFHHYSLALRRLETAGWRSWMLAALAQVSGERQTAPATLEISLWREDTAEFAKLVVDCDTHAQSGGAHQPPQQ